MGGGVLVGLAPVTGGGEHGAVGTDDHCADGDVGRLPAGGAARLVDREAHQRLVAQGIDHGAIVALPAQRRSPTTA